MSSDRLPAPAAAALHALSGALVSLSFPPYGLAWIGLTPSLYALARGSHRSALLGGLTPYARFGWLLPQVCLGAAVLLLIVATVRERRVAAGSPSGAPL